ncbi:MAG: hypothetical protein CVV24_03690 [Ignavibacteriae bacterium HGW-Ignavibacteriae-3]|nr:MAG: hypothetical protein CVV24_03690 [Ignavibacteriae bacterium HGW-Ignavibacteriae-3]
MGHKEKISSSGKGNYFLILGAGALISITVLFSIFMSLRTNFLYSSLLDAIFDIKANSLAAHLAFTKNLDEPFAENISLGMESLDFVERDATIILEQKEQRNIIPIQFQSLVLQEGVQKLQVLVGDYRAMSIETCRFSRNTLDTVLKKKWEDQFRLIQEQSRSIENDIKSIIISQTYDFRIVQLILIGLTLVFSFITMFILFRFEKNRISFIRKIEKANLDLEKEWRKTTRVEEALQSSRRQLDTLIQNLPGMVYRTKCESTWSFEFVSEKCLTLTGYKSGDLINNKIISYYDLIHAEDKKKVSDQILRAIEEKKSYQLVYRIKTTGGYEKWVWEQGVGIFSEIDDELIALEGFVIDITEQKSVEDQLEVQSNALEAAANSIVIMDNLGKVVWCNSAFTLLTGYTIHELMGNELAILKADSFPNAIYEYMWSTAAGGSIWHGEIVHKRKDGTLYDEEMTITPIKDSLGQIKYFVSIMQDITERKKAEEALRESELRFRGLYENATIGIYRSTPEGKILMANPTLLRIFGYNSFEEISSMAAEESYADPKTRLKFLKEITERGNISGFESQWRKKDGTTIYVRESARAFKDSDGVVLYYEGTVEDISDKKKIEEALIEAKEHAEQSDNMKSDFLAQMSHEIRTPLNVILSFTGIMKEELQDKVDDEMKNAFDVIDEEGKRIMRTVELILNMSELQTGSYSYRAKKIDLFKDVLQKSHRSFQIIADRKKILFGLYNNCENAIIEADEYSVIQIFNHLIDNALKYTSRGKVDISLGRDPSNQTYVDISDTGIGIAENFLPSLYSPFTREEKGYTRNYEGNGLGLALVKKYCDLNGATIKVVSAKDKGTTFRVTFPNPK